MPKISMPRKTPSLDMTPMVDLGFILVTFFMLTAKFRAIEPVAIDTPSSNSQIPLPEKVMLITIDPDGRVFFDLTGKDIRRKMFENMAQRYTEIQPKITEPVLERFSILGTFGVPIGELPAYVMLDQKERGAVDKTTKGIPVDSLNNQLADWIMAGYTSFMEVAHEEGYTDEQLRRENGLRYAIKADGTTHYDKVKRVIDTFRDKEIYQFNLVTDLEGGEVEPE